MGDAEKLVLEAEKLGYEVLATKRAFIALIEEIGAERDEAVQKLESLAPNAARCEVEGLKEVMSEIKSATDLQFSLEAMLEKGKDPEGYKRLFAKFKDQVAKAEAAVEKGLVELERREREREDRNKVNAELNEVRDLINETLAKMKRTPLAEDRKAEGELENARREMDKLEMDGDKLELATLQSKAAALCADAQTRCKHVMDKVEKAGAEGKKNFAAAMKVFGGGAK